MIAPLKSLDTPGTPDPKLVLLVEDEASLQEAAKLKLTQLGVPVILARSGEEALGVLKTTLPALIWLDLLLPGMNGLELLRTVKSDPRLKDIPVVVVSVSGGEQKIKEAMALNAADYIVKSQYPLKEIVERVKGVLDRLK